MAAPSTTNEVTVRKLSSVITGVWDKCKNIFQGKLPTTGTASGTYAVNISGNAATATNATNHIANTSNPHGVTKSQVGLSNVTNDSQVKRSEMGTANGVATLDANGIINTSQLPSYVDDVLEYTAKSSFPTTGETGKIYVDTSTNLTWRWSGTQYVEISPSLALGETSSTAYRGDRGKTAYNHTSLTNNPHGVTKAQVGLGSVVDTGDSATPVSGGTTKFTTGGAYTELAKKADKSSAVTNVAWDTTNKKITKTINGTTSDVVTPGTMLDSFEDSTENLAGTGIFIAANPQTAWKKYPISKLWSWIQQSIGSILGLYIDNTTQQKRFSGTSSYAVTATNANNANLSHSYNSSTASGESVLQIGTGTAQSCVRSANTYKVYGFGTSEYANTYWEFGSDTTRPTLTISYQGSSVANIVRMTESSLKYSIANGAYIEMAVDGGLYFKSTTSADATYDAAKWEITKPTSQLKITADRDAEKIEISKSSDSSTITPTNIVSPAVDLYVGGTNNLRLVGSSDGTRVRVCSATNPAALKDLQAQKFYGPLQGNVTGNADTASNLASGQVEMPPHSGEGYIAARTSVNNLATYVEADGSGKRGIWCGGGNREGWLIHATNGGVIYLGGYEVGSMAAGLYGISKIYEKSSNFTIPTSDLVNPGTIIGVANTKSSAITVTFPQGSGTDTAQVLPNSVRLFMVASTTKCYTMMT